MAHVRAGVHKSMFRKSSRRRARPPPADRFHPWHARDGAETVRLIAPFRKDRFVHVSRNTDRTDGRLSGTMTEVFSRTILVTVAALLACARPAAAQSKVDYAR